MKKALARDIFVLGKCFFASYERIISMRYAFYERFAYFGIRKPLSVRAVLEY